VLTQTAEGKPLDHAFALTIACVTVW
jgi:hypothetical protein